MLLLMLRQTWMLRITTRTDMGVLTSLLLLGRIIGTVADAAAVATTVEAAVSAMSPFGLDRLGVLPLGRQLLPMLGKPSRHGLLVTPFCSNSIANVPPLLFLVRHSQQARPKKINDGKRNGRGRDDDPSAKGNFSTSGQYSTIVLFRVDSTLRLYSYSLTPFPAGGASVNTRMLKAVEDTPTCTQDHHVAWCRKCFEDVIVMPQTAA